MRVTVFTLFPEIVSGYCRSSIVGRAIEHGQLDLEVVDIREFTDDVHRSVDDAPFGGGAGMLMKCEPIFRAVEEVEPPRPLFLTAPSGRRFNQGFARELSVTEGFSLICGRYEGFDTRIESIADGSISVGDFVLAGGEIAALAVIEASVRLLPGVLGNRESTESESFELGLLEYPQYTRPSSYREMEVPEILLSGNHAAIERFNHLQSLIRTAERRPDLLAAYGPLSEEEAQVLADHGYAYAVDTIRRSSPKDAPH